MIPNGMLTQIAITILSIGIVVTYVKPTFETISENQNQIGVYKEELKKVAEVNTQLAQLSSSMNSIDAVQQRRLLTYMPDSVDTVAVPRTLEAIAQEAGIALIDISNGGLVAEVSPEFVNPADLRNQPHAETFSMKVEGSYAQMKELLRLLEQNEYPLEVTSMNVEKIEEGKLGISLVITTYNRQLPEENVIINEVTS